MLRHTGSDPDRTEIHSNLRWKCVKQSQLINPVRHMKDFQLLHRNQTLGVWGQSRWISGSSGGSVWSRSDPNASCRPGAGRSRSGRSTSDSERTRFRRQCWPLTPESTEKLTQHRLPHGHLEILTGTMSSTFQERYKNKWMNLIFTNICPWLLRQIFLTHCFWSMFRFTTAYLKEDL